MTRSILALGLASLLMVGAGRLAPAQSAPTTRPAAESHATASRPLAAPLDRARDHARLVVIVVVDQLAAEVLQGAWPYLPADGFRRLEREGASFPNAAYTHACTLTGPGHATIATGASASVHGIVGNEWFEPSLGRAVGCTEDQAVKLFGVGARPVASSAKWLLAPTLGDALKLSFGPRAKVVTVSIKDRSAIFLGGAHADLPIWLDLATGRFTTSTAFAAEEPPFLGKLNAAADLAKYSHWTWDHFGPAEAYGGLDDDCPIERPLGGSRVFPHQMPAIGDGSIDKFVAAIVTSPIGNELIAAAAEKALRELDLGRDDVPDLLGVSFSSNDLVGHACGPASHEVRDMALRVDRHLAHLLTVLDEVVGPGRYDLMLSADHGVGLSPELSAKAGIPAGRVRLDKLRAEIEKALDAGFGDPAPGKWVLALDGSNLHLNRPLAIARALKIDDLADAAAKAAAQYPGVALAIPWPRAAAGTDDVAVAIARAQHPARHPDVYLAPAPHYLFGTGMVASHGTPWDYDRRVPLFIFGPGFRHGYVGQGPAAPGSGVVTIAQALGIPPPALANHPALAEALAP